jgi:hypothetical protein
MSVMTCCCFPGPKSLRFISAAAEMGGLSQASWHACLTDASSVLRAVVEDFAEQSAFGGDPGAHLGESFLEIVSGGRERGERFGVVACAPADSVGVFQAGDQEFDSLGVAVAAGCGAGPKSGESVREDGGDDGRRHGSSARSWSGRPHRSIRRSAICGPTPGSTTPPPQRSVPSCAICTRPSRRMWLPPGPPVACHLRATSVMRPGVPERLAAILSDMHDELVRNVEVGDL